MIQDNLEALSAYTCVSTMLTPAISTSIDTLHEKIFWHQNKEIISTPLIAWDTICILKSHVGLGLRKSLPMNKAFVAKLRWKILTDPDNFWVKLISNKYLQNQSFYFNDSHLNFFFYLVLLILLYFLHKPEGS